MSEYPLWPDSLPLPLLEAGVPTGELPIIRTEMESGPDRVSRTHTPINRTVPLAILVDGCQVAEFWSFFDRAGNAGADWVQLPIDTVNGITHHRARFTAYPQSARVRKNRYRIAFSVETDEQLTEWS